MNTIHLFAHANGTFIGSEKFFQFSAIYLEENHVFAPKCRKYLSVRVSNSFTYDVKGYE
jgi:hypothetical protein